MNEVIPIAALIIPVLILFIIPLLTVWPLKNLRKVNGILVPDIPDGIQPPHARPNFCKLPESRPPPGLL
jgi:hypothetical protein